MYTNSELALLFGCLCISVIGIFILVKKPNLSSCFKSTATKTVTSSSGKRNYENYFKINQNKSISSLTIDSLASKETGFDSFEEYDGFQRRTSRTNSDSFSEDSFDMHYTCAENAQNVCCPCMQHSLNMFDQSKL